MKVSYGDKLCFDVRLVLNNERYELEYGEKIWFNVYSRSHDHHHHEPKILIHIEQESTHIRIPKVTLHPGDYNFDIGIIFADNTTKTILPCIRNQNNILRVTSRSCHHKNQISGSIFENAFDVSTKESSCSCADIGKLYNLVGSLDRKAFIVVNTISGRDSIPKNKLADGKVVKVNDDGTGKPAYFSWNASKDKFIEESFTDNYIVWEDINSNNSDIDEDDKSHITCSCECIKCKN